MSDQTNIEWADSTFNPWMGCTKVSPACDYCYAERDTRRFGRVEWGAGKPRVRTSAANWKLPERWNAKPFYACTNCGWRGDKPALAFNDEPLCWSFCAEPSTLKAARRRVFCASLADWLDNEVPIEWLVDLLDLIRRCPNIDFLLLTKRIGNWRWRLGALKAHLDAEVEPRFELRDWVSAWLSPTVHAGAPANVWLGATVVNQAEADRDVPKLLRVPARVRFLSIEPMLGPVDLTAHLWGRAAPCDRCTQDADCECGYAQRREITDEPAIDWIIAGGESGPHARPMHPDWIRSLRDQCAAAGVPFMVKQLSSGGSKPIKDLSDFPSDLRIRQFPEVSS